MKYSFKSKDFFTYIVGEEKPLYYLLENEFTTLKEEAATEIDWEKFEIAFEKYGSAINSGVHMSEEEKISILRSAVNKKVE